jgi:hypothetical protein
MLLRLYVYTAPPGTSPAPRRSGCGRGGWRREARSKCAPPQRSEAKQKGWPLSSECGAVEPIKVANEAERASVEQSATRPG